ncbi:MAG: tetratricopeptide repeat-containing diguanylate cyclase [Arenimonas sp.]
MKLFAGIVSIGLLIACLCMLPAIALCSPEFEKQLEEADSLRSANPKQFDQLLVQLDANSANASADQLEKLRYLQAYKLAYSGQFNLAIQKAKAIYDSTRNIDLKYRAGLLAVNSYATTRDLGSGFAFLDKTLLLQNKITDKQLRHDGLIVAAVLHNQAGQYELAKHYAEQVRSGNPASRSLCFANNLLLEAQYNLNELPEKDADIDGMIKSCSEHGEQLLANLSRVYLARKWFSQGETNKTITLLEKHLAETEATKYPRAISEVHSFLAESKLKAGDLTQAENHANIAIRESATIPFSLPLVVSEKTLYEIALRRNDPAGAFEHFKKYAEADKAYLNDVKARELAYQLAKHETQQKTQTIALLSKKNQVLQLEQTVAKQKAHYGALLVVLLAALLAIIMLWAYRTKRMQMAFRRLAETDTLTGISNRDHFTKNAEHALVEAAKKSEQLGLVMFDLDNFKSINDRYGHSTGDWVLKKVTEAIQPICRKQDCIGRIGGEEFAILLRASDLESAAIMAERFRERIAAINTGETGHSFIATASFGVTTTLCSGYVFDTLLSQADQALYQSKREGRNRVSRYDAQKSADYLATEATIGL